MNPFHRWYCASKQWGEVVDGLLPWVLDEVELGDHPLELGPGPGLTTMRLAQRVERLTCVEIEGRYARALPTLANGARLDVLEGDATALPLADASCSSAVALTMLHHLPTGMLQDQLFHEVRRVLRPGAVFAGSDSTPRLRWRIYHLFDECAPIDPDGLAARLAAAGFVDPIVEARPGRFRFSATRP